MPVRRMTDEERDRIFGDGVIIVGGRAPRPPKRATASEEGENTDLANNRDWSSKSPINSNERTPSGDTNE